MKRLSMAIGALAWLLGESFAVCAELAPVDPDVCMAQLNAAIERARKGGEASPATRLALAQAQLRCQGADPASAQFIGQINADLALAARDVLLAEQLPTRYRMLLADRGIKLQKFSSDPEFRALYARGDRDADLVPDGLDRCPDSPALSTTDVHGCEFDCERLVFRSSLVTSQQCREQAIGRPEDFDSLRATVIPYNLACESALPPSASTPLGWARIVLESEVISPTATTELRALKLFAVKSPARPPGCEVFYEFHLRFDEPTGVRSTGVMFSAEEDRTPANPDIATFVLPAVRVTSESVIGGGPFSAWQSISVIPLPGGRAIARDGFLANTEVFWRVRTVNGMGSTLGWSEFRRQSVGPDLAP